MKKNCIKSERPDNSILICLWCEGVEMAKAKANELEENGKNVICGICPQCLADYKADSLKETNWELRY